MVIVGREEVRGVEWLVRSGTNMASFAIMPGLFPHLFPHGDPVNWVFLTLRFRLQQHAVRNAWESLVTISRVMCKNCFIRFSFSSVFSELAATSAESQMQTKSPIRSGVL